MKILREDSYGDTAALSLGQNRASPTRVEILDEAARLIVDGGYEAFTMRAVALRVNIKAGSLYHHFKSKEEIVAEILNSGIAMLLEEVEQKLSAVHPNAPFAERIGVAIQAHIACMLGRDTMQVYEHLPPVLKRRSRAMRVKYAKLWFQLFQSGIEDGEIDPNVSLNLFVPYFLGGLNRIPEWFRQRRGKISDVSEMATRALLSGVAVRSSRQKSVAGRRRS